MKKKLLFLAIVLIFCILQVTLIDYIKIFGVNPDLLLIIVVMFGLSLELKQAIFFSIAIGIFKDLFGINTLPINTVLFASFTFLIARLSKDISFDSNITKIALVFVAAVCHALLIRLIFACLDRPIPLGIFLRIAFLGPVYTALISPLVFKVIKPSLYS